MLITIVLLILAAAGMTYLISAWVDDPKAKKIYMTGLVIIFILLILGLWFGYVPEVKYP